MKAATAVRPGHPQIHLRTCLHREVIIRDFWTTAYAVQDARLNLLDELFSSELQDSQASKFRSNATLGYFAVYTFSLITVDYLLGDLGRHKN